KKLAYSSYPNEGRWQVRLMNPDGTQKQDLIDNAGGSRASWAPDGKRLAFLSLRAEDGFRLYTIDADGKNARDLFSHPAPVLTTIPHWSPDGKTLAFTEWNGDEKKVQITTVSADGKGPKVLTKKDAHAHPRWAPDGKSLSYGRFEDEHGYFRDE